MDGDARSRPPILVLVVVAALLVGLSVYGALALFGDDDDSGDAGTRPPVSGPGPTSALSPTTTTPGSTATPPAGVPTTVAGDGPVATIPGSPGPDSEACAMFRQLLELVDDPALRGAAAQVGCL